VGVVEDTSEVWVLVLGGVACTAEGDVDIWRLPDEPALKWTGCGFTDAALAALYI
jgi:hypothetical protein